MLVFIRPAGDSAVVTHPLRPNARIGCEEAQAYRERLKGGPASSDPGQISTSRSGWNAAFSSLPVGDGYPAGLQTTRVRPIV